MTLKRIYKKYQKYSIW